MRTIAAGLTLSLGVVAQEVLVVDNLFNQNYDVTVAKWTNTFDMIDGFLIGALGTEHIYDVDICVEDLDPIAHDIDEVFNCFSSLDSFEKVVEGVAKIGIFITDLKTALHDCESVSKTDLDNLEKMGELFLHPKQLFMDIGRNLFMNGIDIYNEIKTGKADQENGWYLQAGKAFGEAASLLLWGGEENLLSLY